MAPGLADVKRFFAPGLHNESAKKGSSHANGLSTEPVLGSHGKPLMTTAAGHPISDDNNR